MLRPSDKSTYRIARLVIRTHAVPMPVSANGSTTSAIAIRTTPALATSALRAADGVSIGVFGVSALCRALCAVADALAQQAVRPEDQHRDQHEEREHVLIVAAEQRQ